MPFGAKSQCTAQKPSYTHAFPDYDDTASPSSSALASSAFCPPIAMAQLDACQQRLTYRVRRLGGPMQRISLRLTSTCHPGSRPPAKFARGLSCPASRPGLVLRIAATLPSRLPGHLHTSPHGRAQQPRRRFACTSHVSTSRSSRPASRVCPDANSKVRRTAFLTCSDPPRSDLARARARLVQAGASRARTRHSALRRVFARKCDGRAPWVCAIAPCAHGAVRTAQKRCLGARVGSGRCAGGILAGRVRASGLTEKRCVWPSVRGGRRACFTAARRVSRSAMYHALVLASRSATRPSCIIGRFPTPTRIYRPASSPRTFWDANSPANFPGAPAVLVRAPP